MERDVAEWLLIVQLVDRSIPHGGPIDRFLVPPVLHYWYNKDHGMCYPVCGILHIKEPLLFIGKEGKKCFI